MKGVHTIRVTYHLHATCANPACTFERRAGHGISPARVRADAQRHARDHPGHTVSADILNRTTYAREEAS